MLNFVIFTLGKQRQHNVALVNNSDDEMYTEVVYLDDQMEDVVQDSETNEESADEFYCSSCNINITSVEEHIRDYHFGENIVVEVRFTHFLLWCRRCTLFAISGSSISSEST